jgi:hypothetical protein
MEGKNIVVREESYVGQSDDDDDDGELHTVKSVCYLSFDASTSAVPGAT